MKKALDAIPYLLSFVLLEVVLFSLLYVVHAQALKGFGLYDALAKGGYALLWRVLSLQVFMQLGLLTVAAGFGFQRNYLVVLSLSLVAFFVASALSFSGFSSAWRLMQFPTRDSMGEGFAILVSVTIAYLLLIIVFSQKSP